MPSSNRERPPSKATEDSPSRADEALDLMVPHDPNTPYDMAAVVRRVLDDRQAALGSYGPRCTATAIPDALSTNTTTTSYPRTPSPARVAHVRRRLK